MKMRLLGCVMLMVGCLAMTGCEGTNAAAAELNRYDGSVAVESARWVLENKTTPVVPDKVPRDECTTCDGKGWYMSGDGLAKIECQHCYVTESEAAEPKAGAGPFFFPAPEPNDTTAVGMPRLNRVDFEPFFPSERKPTPEPQARTPQPPAMTTEPNPTPAAPAPQAVPDSAGTDCPGGVCPVQTSPRAEACDCPAGACSPSACAAAGCAAGNCARSSGAGSCASGSCGAGYAYSGPVFTRHGAFMERGPVRRFIRRGPVRTFFRNGGFLRRGRCAGCR